MWVNFGFILDLAKLKLYQSSPLKSEEPAKVGEDLPDLQDKDIESVTKKIQLASKSKKTLVAPPKPSKLPVVVATSEPLKSEDQAREKEDLPNLQDKDVERVAKKMQIAFRSKKSPVTPTKQSKPEVATTEPLKSKDPAKEKEDLPNLQDRDVERVAKKMQIAFRSKKLPITPAEQSKSEVATTTEELKSGEPAGEKGDLPDLQDKEIERVTKKIQNPFKSKKSQKSIVEVLDYAKMSKSEGNLKKEGMVKLANGELFGQSKIVEPVSQSVSINAALGKIEILENENRKLEMELEELRKQLKRFQERCKCQTKRIQMPNHKGDTLYL